MPVTLRGCGGLVYECDSCYTASGYFSNVMVYVCCLSEGSCSERSHHERAVFGREVQ